MVGLIVPRGKAGRRREYKRDEQGRFSGTGRVRRARARNSGRGRAGSRQMGRGRRSAMKALTAGAIGGLAAGAVIATSRGRAAKIGRTMSGLGRATRRVNLAASVTTVGSAQRKVGFLRGAQLSVLTSTVGGKKSTFGRISRSRRIAPRLLGTGFGGPRRSRSVRFHVSGR